MGACSGEIHMGSSSFPESGSSSGTNLKTIDSVRDGETVVWVESLSLKISLLANQHWSTSSCSHLSSRNNSEEDAKIQKRKNVKKRWFTQHVFSAQNVESVRGIAALTEVRYIIAKFFYR